MICCDKPKALIEQGKAFLENARNLCTECPDRVEQKCSVCGCHLQFKIVAGLLIKSTCPKGKW